MNKSAGLTIIELLVTVAVAAVLLSIGAPQFSAFVENNRATRATNDLITALTLARSEAVKRGERVSICSSDDQATCLNNSDWAQGWIIFVNTADDGAPAVGNILRIGQELPDRANLESSPGYVNYRELGDVDDPVEFTLAFDDCVGEHRRVIRVNPAGSASVTRTACDV